MRYEAIAAYYPEAAKISAIKQAPEIFCAEIDTDRRNTMIKYTVEDYGRASHIKVSSISYEAMGGEGPEVIMPHNEKDFPEDFLEELSVLVKVHRTTGVYWNSFCQVEVFDPQDHFDYHLTYEVVPSLGPVPKVIRHEKQGNFFFKHHDEVTYKSIPDEVVAEYLSQANRLKSNVAIPDWVLIRDHSQGEIKYRRLKDTSNTPAFVKFP